MVFFVCVCVSGPVWGDFWWGGGEGLCVMVVVVVVAAAGNKRSIPRGRYRSVTPLGATKVNRTIEWTMLSIIILLRTENI